MLFLKYIALLIGISVFSVTKGAPVYTREAPLIKVSVAQLPGLANSYRHGVFIDFLEEVDQAYEGRIEVSVAPFSRSLINVHNGINDVHLPMLNARFVLITHVNINIDDVDVLRNLMLFTEAAHMPLFPSTKATAACISCSIRMVSKRRMDGYIFSDYESQRIIKEYELNNLRITPMIDAPASFVAKNTPEGKAKLALFESLIERTIREQPERLNSILSASD